LQLASPKSPHKLSGHASLKFFVNKKETKEKSQIEELKKQLAEERELRIFYEKMQRGLLDKLTNVTQIDNNTTN